MGGNKASATGPGHFCHNRKSRQPARTSEGLEGDNISLSTQQYAAEAGFPALRHTLRDMENRLQIG